MRTAATQKDVTRRIFRMLGATAMLTIAALVVLAFWMAATVNDLAQSKNTELVRAVLSTKHDAIATMTQDYADWETAYDWVVSKDDEQVLLNIGSGTTESGFFDVSFIYQPDGTLLYAYEVGGEESDPTLAERSFAAPILEAVSTLPVLPYDTIRTIAVYDGQPALVAAGRFQPYDATDEDVAKLPVLINLRLLNGGILTQMQSDLLLDGMTLTDQQTARLILANADGEPVTGLTWQPAYPGQVMLERTLWITLVLAIAIGLGHYTVARMSVQQTQAYLAARLSAEKDGLTGLLSRWGFDRAIESDAIQAALRNGTLGLVFLDMDDFKAINDTYGHAVGDLALVAMADRLRAIQGPDDIVVRMGGDEFVMVVKGRDAYARVSDITEKLNDAAQDWVELSDGITLNLHGAIGHAVAKPGDDFRKLILQADAEMYRVKTQRKGQVSTTRRDLTDYASAS